MDHILINLHLLTNSMSASQDIFKLFLPVQSKETNPGPFKVDQTTLVWILLTHSQMEECLSVFVIQFLTSQLMLNLVQRSVQMWLTESGTEPGRHLWLTLTWWRLLELTHPDDQSEWENHTQVNGCHERRSCWLSSEWKSLKCEVCRLLAITPCFFFHLSCALIWIFCYKHEETLPRGKFCLWKSTGWVQGVVKVTLCFALKKDSSR